MTSIRLLYELQELDQEIAQNRSRMTAIDQELAAGVGLDAIQRDVETQRTHLQELTVKQKSQDLEAESMREKLRDIEGKLYGGSITNLKEIEGFEKEAGYLRGHLQELDDRNLAAMVALEEEQEKLHSLEEGHRRAGADWSTKQADLQQEHEGLGEALASLESRRGEFVSDVEGPELKLYERLRQSKGGQAIAKVERGLCRGCRMALPTHQLQRARVGREPVLCSSCGRILYVS